MASAASQFPLAPSPAIFQQRRLNVLLSLQKAAQQIASILELDDLLDTVVHRVAVDFGCIESSILLVEGDEFHLAAVHGCTQSNKGERWPITEGLSGQVQWKVPFSLLKVLKRMAGTTGLEPAVMRLFKYLAETCGYEKSRETRSGTAIVP